MKTFFSLLQIISIFVLIGCEGNSSNYQPFPLSDVQTDFPECDTLTFKKWQTYDIKMKGVIMISDSGLWNFYDTPIDNLGDCYDLNTGEKLSSIATIGRAKNEVELDLNSIGIANDSMYIFYDERKLLKIFPLNDILNNVPVGERKVNMKQFPDTLYMSGITPLSDGSILSTLSFNFNPNLLDSKEITPSVAIINDTSIKTYQTINYDSYSINLHEDQSLSVNNFIKLNYAYGNVSAKGNSMAVLSVDRQAILYTLDLTTGKVINEKRYTEMKCEGGGFLSQNDLDLNIVNLESNDDYIVCILEGFMNEKEKKEKKQKRILLVFDWNLNPIKCFSLPNPCILSKDNPLAVFEFKMSDRGLTLYKADLNL